MAAVEDVDVNTQRLDTYKKFLESYTSLRQSPYTLQRKFLPMEQPDYTHNIYVVSHSRVMQKGIDILDMQQRLNENVKTKKNWDFEENLWTAELLVSNRKLMMYDLHKGVFKPKKKKEANDTGQGEPHTIIWKDEECKTDDDVRFADLQLLAQRNWDSAQNLLQNIRATRSNNSLEAEYTEEEVKTQDLRDDWQHFFRNIKKYTGKLYSEPVPFDHDTNISLFITRHANSCNNISSNFYYLYKKIDPSLSQFGVWSLKKIKPVKLKQLSNQRQDGDPIYVSSCIRTWETALLTYFSPEKPNITLIVSPFIKEEGNFTGNLPESIDAQRKKIKDWIDDPKHFGTAKPIVIILMGKTDATQQDVQIYPKPHEGIVVSKYESAHLTFFPDGILRFSKWIEQRINKRPQPVVHGDKLNPSPNHSSGRDLHSFGGKSRKNSVKQRKKLSRHKYAR